MNDALDQYVKPIPILQWLVVIVLCVDVITHSQPPLGISYQVIFIFALLTGNAILLYGLPKIISVSALATTLVAIDTVLVPATLYATGTTPDLFVVYFGIIMIGAASGDLKRSLALAAATWLAYAAFTLLTSEDYAALGTILLRLPFFLVVTLFYGVLGEFAQRERTDKEKLAYAAMHDELTGLPNRRLLLDTLARELEGAKRFDCPLSCAIMDVDYFKRVNDTHGHDMGDLVLRDYSSLLAVQSRGYDLAGRLGGDEYVWILPRVDMEGATAAGERLREAVERYQFGSGHTTFRLTTSIGLTTYLPGKSLHPSPAEMLKTADVALYEAKNQGRNRVCFQSMADGAAPLTAESKPVGGGTEGH